MIQINREFLDQLNNYQLPEENPTAWSYHKTFSSVINGIHFCPTNWHVQISSGAQLVP
jgi:hypothetical protein